MDFLRKIENGMYMRKQTTGTIRNTQQEEKGIGKKKTHRLQFSSLACPPQSIRYKQYIKLTKLLSEDTQSNNEQALQQNQKETNNFGVPRYAFGMTTGFEGYH